MVEVRPRCRHRGRTRSTVQQQLSPLRVPLAPVVVQPGLWLRRTSTAQAAGLRRVSPGPRFASPACSDASCRHARGAGAAIWGACLRDGAAGERRSSRCPPPPPPRPVLPDPSLPHVSATLSDTSSARAGAMVSKFEDFWILVYVISFFSALSSLNVMEGGLAVAFFGWIKRRCVGFGWPGNLLRLQELAGAHACGVAPCCQLAVCCVLQGWAVRQGQGQGGQRGAEAGRQGGAGRKGSLVAGWGASCVDFVSQREEGRRRAVQESPGGAQLQVAGPCAVERGQLCMHTTWHPPVGHAHHAPLP